MDFSFKAIPTTPNPAQLDLQMDADPAKAVPVNAGFDFPSNEYAVRQMNADWNATSGPSYILNKPNPYVLPIASDSILGGIKVGANLSIDVNGVLSAQSSYVLPIASATVLGGIKIGSGLSIDVNGVLSSTTTVSQPTNQVVYGSGTGIASNSQFTYDSIWLTHNATGSAGVFAGIQTKNFTSSGGSRFVSFNDLGKGAYFGMYGSAYTAVPLLQGVAGFGSDNSITIFTDAASSTGGAGKIIFSAGGYNSEVARVTSQGLIIGATAFVGAENLRVNGGFRFDGNGAIVAPNATLQLVNNGSTTAAIQYLSNTSTQVATTFINTSNARFITTSSFDIAFTDSSQTNSLIFLKTSQTNPYVSFLPVFSGTSAVTWNAVTIAPTYNQTSGTGAMVGLYYNPTVTSVTGTHYALYINSGISYFASSVLVGTTLNNYGSKLSVLSTVTGAQAGQVSYTVVGECDVTSGVSTYYNGLFGRVYAQGATSQGFESAGVSGNMYLKSTAYTYTSSHVWAGVVGGLVVDASTADKIASIKATLTVQNAGTITNYYAVYIQAPTKQPGSTVTNEWGIFQESTTAKNSFAGVVGINTVSFVGAEKLNVAGDTYLNGFAYVKDGNSIIFGPPGTSSSAYSLNGNGNAGGNGITLLNSGATPGGLGYIGFRISNVTQGLINGYGNMILGTTTAYPSYYLDQMAKLRVNGLIHSDTDIAAMGNIFTRFAAPGIPTLTGTTGGTLPANSYYIAIAIVDLQGNVSMCGTEAFLAVDGTTTNKVTVSWAAVANVSSYRVYVGLASGAGVKYWTTTTNSFNLTAYGAGDGSTIVTSRPITPAANFFRANQSLVFVQAPVAINASSLIASEKLRVNGDTLSVRYVETQPTTIAAATTTTVDLSTGNMFQVSMGLNVTTLTLSNPAVGQYIIKFTQDATGSRTIAWPAGWKWSGGTVPVLTTTANKTDVLTLTYDGTDYYVSIQLNF